MPPEKPSPCFVATIDLQLTEKLREDLISQGFELSKPPYTIFAAQKKGISCSLYLSGKITVQGKDKADFLLYYLEPEILKSLAFSYPEEKIDFKPHIGIDESGKGDFFGPLCIAGVYASADQIKELLKIGVRDSKTISPKTILTLSTKIKNICPHSIIQISPKRYNEMYANFRNLNRLLAWGHATAIADLISKTQCTDVIIDQFASEDVVLSALKQKKIEVSLTQRHKAEADPVVAAASILARASFVQGLERLGNDLSITLPKGASADVKRVGVALVAKHGEAILETIAKLHFKTTAEILS